MKYIEIPEIKVEIPGIWRLFLEVDLTTCFLNQNSIFVGHTNNHIKANHSFETKATIHFLYFFKYNDAMGLVNSWDTYFVWPRK